MSSKAPGTIHFHAEVANYGREVSLFAQTEGFAIGDSLYRLAPVEFRRITEEEHFHGSDTGPAITLFPAQAQQLMDELFRVGFRPTHGGVGDLERAAMKEHLADMRRLVFEFEVSVPQPRIENREADR